MYRNSTKTTLELTQLAQNELDMAVKLYSDEKEEFLRLRDRKELQKFICEYRLFGVKHKGTLVASAYIIESRPSGQTEYELGGIYVDEEYRGESLGKAVSVNAILRALFTTDESNPTQELVFPKIVAKVNVINKKPRNLLRGLGFFHVATVSETVAQANDSNNNMEVKKDLFEASHKTLTVVQQWLSNYAENGGRIKDAQIMSKIVWLQTGDMIEEAISSLNSLLNETNPA